MLLVNSPGADSIRNMQPLDIDDVVHTHLLAFPGFFLTFLGGGFLRALYLSILYDSSGIAFLYEENGGISGFVSGTSQSADFYKRIIIKRWWHFGLASIRPLIRNPKIFPRLVRALKMPSEASKADYQGTLMSIAVLPSCQGKGIGTALVKAFLEEASLRGLKRVVLTTDRSGNDAVNHFYWKLGFSVSRMYTTPDGREMNEYFIDLKQSLN